MLTRWAPSRNFTALALHRRSRFVPEGGTHLGLWRRKPQFSCRHCRGMLSSAPRGVCELQECCVSRQSSSNQQCTRAAVHLHCHTHARKAYSPFSADDLPLTYVCARLCIKCFFSHTRGARCIKKSNKNCRTLWARAASGAISNIPRVSKASFQNEASFP